jgi:DNA-binding LacI/PurR family transcriptional regulator
VWSPPVLEDCALDRKSSTPLHRQVRDNLEAKIRSEVLRPYDRLPPVRQLAKAFGVGPGTIVQALSALGQDGLVTSRQGSGTFVLPTRPSTTALCFPFGSRSSDDPFSQMGQQILDGLRRGFGDDHEIHIIGSTHEMSADDIYKICRIKNTDGLVYHSHMPRMRDTMVELAERMPVIGLLQTIPRGVDSKVDTFLGNPRPVLEELLRDRFARGQKRLACVWRAEQKPERGQGQDDAYAMMYDTLHRVAEDAGLDVAERTVAADVYEAWYAGEEVAIPYEPLPKKATLVTMTPSLARMARVMQPDAKLDAISYCTGLFTLRTSGPGMTVMYLGAEKVAEKAARHLLRRVESGASEGGKRMLVKPEVVVDYRE